VDIISSVKGKETWNVMVRDEKTGAITNKKCDAVIVAIGFVPSIVLKLICQGQLSRMFKIKLSYN